MSHSDNRSVNEPQQQQMVFVTVGSTSFDSLIETILQDGTLSLLKDKGYKKVVLQTGRGKDFSSSRSSSIFSFAYFGFDWMNE
jgi:UDP-N-acetylglucosamine transferase subunit ALG13